MIVKESESKSYLCPVIAFRDQNSTAKACRGKTCMAWREVTKDHGFCGMTNMGDGHTTKEYKHIVALQENENDL